MPTDEEAAIRDRLAKLAAEGRHVERDAVAWQLAIYIMRGPQGSIRNGGVAEPRVRAAALSDHRGGDANRKTAHRSEPLAFVFCAMFS